MTIQNDTLQHQTTTPLKSKYRNLSKYNTTEKGKQTQNNIKKQLRTLKQLNIEQHGTKGTLAC